MLQNVFYRLPGSMWLVTVENRMLDNICNLTNYIGTVAAFRYRKSFLLNEEWNVITKLLLVSVFRANTVSVLFLFL